MFGLRFLVFTVCVLFAGVVSSSSQGLMSLKEFRTETISMLYSYGEYIHKQQHVLMLCDTEYYKGNDLLLEVNNLDDRIRQSMIRTATAEDMYALQAEADTISVISRISAKLSDEIVSFCESADRPLSEEVPDGIIEEMPLD